MFLRILPGHNDLSAKHTLKFMAIYNQVKCILLTNDWAIYDQILVASE
ncbi:hypothetical protein EVA_08145 [gut metagenome]|uniref:Uncharacterized protein n=1 Tax=gut metagenome TaxID=749906 RepID=J9GN68_9ZZZZ